MNTQHDDMTHHPRFDGALRTHHAASLRQLSPRVRAQLAQRRNAALRGELRTAASHGMRYAAAGFAAVCALAIGLQFGPMTGRQTPAAGTGIAPAPSATTSTATMLDEDPEFYAWLASSDAQLVAME